MTFTDATEPLFVNLRCINSRTGKYIFTIYTWFS